ncbi:MAG: hypothetical protein ABSF45_15970 [Terriglobia bacterium]|jgi:hypothetical protein
MENLKLRQVGTRHVAYGEDGKPVGEVQEAHLKAYVASLPGAYYQTPEQKDTGCFAAQRFADAVQTRAYELRKADPHLPELEAHRMASSQVSQKNPALLAAYRKDVQEI